MSISKIAASRWVSMIPKSFSFFQTLILVIHVLSKHTKQLLCFLRIQRLHGQKYLCWIIDAKQIMFNHRKGGGRRGGVGEKGRGALHDI